jgi:outer membrane lipoprotein-sorting protein
MAFRTTHARQENIPGKAPGRLGSTHLLIHIKGDTNMKTRTMTSFALALAFGIAFAGPIAANTPAEQGFEIAARSDRTDVGFGDSRVELQMILQNAAGQQSTRKLKIATLEKPDESVGDKSLVLFETPRDIEGTALLSHAKILDPDDQWLFLPALKRVKRIASSNKSGPFVGSEFAFEDFTAIELNKFDYRYIGTETYGAFQTDVLERQPRYENSGYSKQISWIDQDVFQIRKVEFYDRRGDLLKVLKLEDYRQYHNGVWRAHKLTMENVQTNKKTDMVYQDYAFNVGISARDFTKGRLSRLR